MFLGQASKLKHCQELGSQARSQRERSKVPCSNSASQAGSALSGAEGEQVPCQSQTHSLADSENAALSSTSAGPVSGHISGRGSDQGRPVLET